MNSKTDFNCVRCGNCCRTDGFVRISAREVEIIATELGMAAVAFVEQYTVLTGDRRGLQLKELPDQSCIMLDESNRCRIQNSKPVQCKGFPHTWSYDGWEEICGAAQEDLAQ